MALFSRRISRSKRGGYDLRLPDAEREVLAAVLPELEALVVKGRGGDPTTTRLFPSAYPNDGERDAEYQQMVGDELVGRRRAALAAMQNTLQSDHLDDDEMDAWMATVNDLRLVIGTRLNVSEQADPVPNPDDPNAGLLSLYGYLGYLLEMIVEALSEE